MVRMMSFCVSAFLVLGCATSSFLPLRVDLSQTSTVAPFRFQLEGGLPVVYRLQIKNPNDHLVTLTAVELESIGLSGAYALQKMRQTFRETIPAGATNSIDVRAWVQPLQQTHRGKIVGVVTLRGTATFDSMGKRGTASFSAQVKQ